MRFYIAVTGLLPDEAISLARRAEELGYDGLGIPDHLAMPTEIETLVVHTHIYSGNHTRRVCSIQAR